jgi:hypothetical protein
MKEITHIQPLHAAFVLSLVTLIGSFLATLLFNFPSIFLAGNGFEPARIFILLAVPLSSAAFSFVAVAIGCANYNWIARRWGGIKIFIS